MTDITQLKDCMFAELGLEIKYMTCTLYSVYAPPPPLRNYGSATVYISMIGRS